MIPIGNSIGELYLKPLKNNIKFSVFKDQAIKVGVEMKGVSGIVAAAILLALTIAGGLLLYTYVSRYLVLSTQSGELVIESAYYLTTLKRLEVTVRNIGMTPVNVTKAVVICENGTLCKNSTLSVIIPPGKAQSIPIENISERPQYIIVEFDNERKTEPAAIRVLG